MRVIPLLLWMSACGLTRVESADDAAVDSSSLADILNADAPSADAPNADAPALDGSMLAGNCAPTESTCPSAATTLEIGDTFEVSGTLVQGQADVVQSNCGGGGTSEWTVAVTAAEAGLLQIIFASGATYGIEVRDGGCTGTSTSCGVTNNSQTTNGIDAGQTLLIVVEAATVCDVPFALSLALLPRGR
ncbi:MAG: hypothetical protein ACI9KE_002982 [Polyangiales bacterium]|jgi:hypothetical protein